MNRDDHELEAPARGLALRAQLLVPVIVASVPLAVFAAALMFTLWQYQQNRLETQQKETAAALASVVDKELSSTVRQLQYLGTGPELVRGDFDGFLKRTRQVLAVAKEWTNVVLFSRDGRQLVNANFPLPSGRSTATQRHVDEVFATGKPMVSDAFLGPASGRWIVAVSVPVALQGRPIYVLSATLNLAVFDQLLKERTAAGGVASIEDRQLRILSRAPSPEEYRGKPPVRELLEAMRAAPEGLARFRSYEGIDVFTAWTRIASIGWTVAFAVPTESTDVALRRHILLLGSAELLIFLTAAFAAIFIGRRVSGAIERAARQAPGVAEGWRPELPRTGIEELDRLGRALEDAASKLSAEARQRELAERERDQLLALEKEARSAAEAANRSKDEFLAMLGHELRNPLGAVSNAAQVLDREGARPEQIAFARGVIARQTQHLARLIDDLLDVGRVITGKIYLQRERMDLSAAVRGTLDAFHASGRFAGHRATFDLDPVWIDGDRTRIEQVATNLVSNALAYTPAGGSIRVSARREGGDAVLEVADDGIGMAPEELKRVFDLFYQGKSELHRKGGLGLGLTLVHRLVELHGGFVTARSDGPGRGATFTVRLPAAEAPAPDEEPPAPAASTRPLDILIVEDNADARVSLQIVLEAEGHTVHTAADGKAGLDAFERIVPDVALIDIGLPGIDGYELARAIRARHAGPMLVALTGYGQPEDTERAAQAGFDAHLVKPADLAKLRTLLARRRRRDA
ncbi:MAG TPA: ATP-binding protein [Burkholderiales bacterium]|nr:ATP-binding protein [Burkholderiales bacterium]